MLIPYAATGNTIYCGWATYNGCKVDFLVPQDELISQPFVSRLGIEQTPVDTQIPVVCVDCGNDGGDDKQHPQREFVCRQVAVIRVCLSQPHGYDR